MGQGYKAVLEKNDVLWNVSVWEIQEVLFSSFLPVNKKVETKKKEQTNKSKPMNIPPFLLVCLPEPEQTEYILNWIQPVP